MIIFVVAKQINTIIMDYELNKLHLASKERERLLLRALKQTKHIGCKNFLIGRAYIYNRKRFQQYMKTTYGNGSLGALLASLKGRGYIEAPEGKPYQITPRGKIALKRGYIDVEPEKPYQKYLMWCGVIAIPVGLFNPEIRIAAKWLWRVLSDFLCRIF